MGIFGNKKETEKEKVVAATPKTSSAKKVAKKVVKKATGVNARSTKLRDVLLHPHITEKAAQLTAQNVYTFDITQRATKGDVMDAIEEAYKVKPVKIGIVKTPGSRVRLRKRRGYGRKSASKKAYVYLKKGDRIEFAS